MQMNKLLNNSEGEHIVSFGEKLGTKPQPCLAFKTPPSRFHKTPDLSDV